MGKFDIPVVLFTFKRVDKTLEILERVAQIKPSKLFILSDQGRNSQEIEVVNELRERIETRIDWDCEIVKRYAEENIGVYQNIGAGAQWVLEREKWAIFLEDDNLPEISFFQFCKDLLEFYENDSRVLWICGTNYLKEYQPEDNSSYVFTQHMLPCGWASWGNKFNKFYDGNLELWDDKYIKKRIQFENENKLLLRQDVGNWDRERRNIIKGKRPDSWDYQMGFALRANGLYGIVPKYNQIKNIGVDLDSIHGGVSFDMEMTRRFCGIETMQIQFPLIHPKVVMTDKKFEKLTAKIILLPFGLRLKERVAKFLKNIFNVDPDQSLKKVLLRRN